MTIKAGDKAKDFALNDQDGKDIHLSDFSGKKVLLSDFWPHGDVARSYGIFREKEGFSERANIIVDVNGKVIFVKVYPISQLPDIEEIIKALEKREK